MKQVLMAIGWVALFLGIAAVGGEAADPPSSETTRLTPSAIELRFRYDPQTRHLTLADQRALKTTAPKRRNQTPQPGEFLVQYENRAGAVLGRLPITDPTILLTDRLARSSPRTPGLLTGAQVRLTETEFVVVIPFDSQVARVTLLRPHFASDGTIERLDAVGSCPIP